MRASWLEHSCLLASCVSLLFLIQGKTRINKSCMGGMKRTLTFFSSESPSCVSADYNSAWDRKYKRMLCSIRKMSHFSFYWHTVAGKKKKKTSSECVHHDSCAGFTLNWFLFPALTLLIFSVCPAVPSLPTVSQSVSVSVPLLSLLSCCQLFVLRLF